MRLVITGTPGTGKTVLAKKAAERFRLPLYPATAIAKKMRWVKRGVANLRKLREYYSSLPGGFIAEGHLLCEFPVPGAKCLVLRTQPCELEKRLKARGYSKRKTRQNVECEVIDYCLLKAEENYGEVLQADNTFFPPLEKALEGGAECDWVFGFASQRTI